MNISNDILIVSVKMRQIICDIFIFRALRRQKIWKILDALNIHKIINYAKRGAADRAVSGASPLNARSAAPRC